MKTTLDWVLFLSFSASLLMATLSALSSRRLKSPEFFHLTEFWASMAVMVLVDFLVKDSPSGMIQALILLGWIWPVKSTLQVLEDLSHQKIMNRGKWITLGSGAFISLALSSYNFPFHSYMAPFCLALGGVMLTSLWQVYKAPVVGTRSVLHYSTYALITLLFAQRFFYPLWGDRPEVALIMALVDHLVIMGFLASTLSLYVEIMGERHEGQLESVVKERNDQLFGQSKYAELGMMSAGIAHEINNPLAIIQAKVTQLLRIYTKPERLQDLADGLNQILYTSERINRTIQGVREFVHQDDSMPDEDISVKDLVDDVMAFCGQRMKNHGVNLRFYGLDNFHVRGHKIQLEQVLLNLLNNSFDAIEFLPDKWIEISVHESDRMVQLFFKDSGPGIPPEIATRMMEAFYTTKDMGKGTGLGLALARGIVEKHEGSLSYVSDAAHTTFKLELPKRDLVRDFRPKMVRHKSSLLPLTH